MICTVVGARPNFIKMAPVVHELQGRKIPQLFVHTGQHYDAQMSAIFFTELQMPEPDIYLGVGSGSHAEQTGRILTAFEAVCQDHHPGLVVVAGDVNSTLACALTATKLQIPVAHVEAGLRSFDRRMPEEINRVLTDHISDILFTTEPSGSENLKKEGISPSKVYYVGNSMIDSLHAHRSRAIALEPWKKHGLEAGKYGVVTLHRPSNVDQLDVAQRIAEALGTLAHTLPLLFPIHPRTLAHSGEVWRDRDGLQLVEPLGYLEFLGLMASAELVITDSGGIQEETTALQVRCLTIRENTERPITVSKGTNRLVAPVTEEIVQAAQTTLGQPINGQIPDLWDGKASQRIVDVIEQWQKDNDVLACT
jgi:UDP-N-acetylglucosamine 2-epimerase (non-hydrolysing)